MAYLDTLLINGHDVRTMTGIRVVGYMELFAPGDRRGGDDGVVPGSDGELPERLPRAKYVMSVPIRVMGATRGERNDILRTVSAICEGDHGIVPLARRIATGSGDDHVQHTTTGQFVTGLSLTLLNDTTGTTELQFYNMRGGWWDGSAWIL